MRRCEQCLCERAEPALRPVCNQAYLVWHHWTNRWHSLLASFAPGWGVVGVGGSQEASSAVIKRGGHPRAFSKSSLCFVPSPSILATQQPPRSHTAAPKTPRPGHCAQSELASRPLAPLPLALVGPRPAPQRIIESCQPPSGTSSTTSRLAWRRLRYTDDLSDRVRRHSVSLTITSRFASIIACVQRQLTAPIVSRPCSGTRCNSTSP